MLLPVLKVFRYFKRGDLQRNIPEDLNLQIQRYVNVRHPIMYVIKTPVSQTSWGWHSSPSSRLRDSFVSCFLM